MFIGSVLILTLAACLLNNQQINAQDKPSSIRLVYPNGLAINDKQELFISDVGTHSILKLDRKGVLTIIAGTGEGGFGGDGEAATKAQLFSPHDLLFDREGNLLIADTNNHRIRRIDQRGVITTIAGNGKAAYAGDNGPAITASLNNPQSIAVDRDGNLLIADTYNHVVRRVDQSGKITTFAGTIGGFGGDGGEATKAQMSLPMAVAAAPDGNVYVSDGGNSRIRQITPDGKIKTIVGYGPAQDTYGGGYGGDGGPADKAKIFNASDIKIDSAGNIYLSDSGNCRIRIIKGGIISSIAGIGNAGFSGDGKLAVTAELNTPQKIALTKDGIIYIADRANHRVRKIDVDGRIASIVGEGSPSGMYVRGGSR